jgi:RNA polymerase sigma-70 factor (ECF subfamily)
VKLWNHRDRIEGDKVRPWLMTVTRNACLDRLRRRKQTYSLEEWHQVDESPGPMQGTMQRDLGRVLHGAIAALREPYRSLVILRDVHQHSYEEVAAVLELNLSQVRVYLHRARKQLRQELAGVRP